MGKWKTEIIKSGTDINITNGRYTFHLDTAHNDKMRFSENKQRDLIEDARLFCLKLNAGNEWKINDNGELVK